MRLQRALLTKIHVMLNPQLLCVSFLLNLKKGRHVWIWLGAQLWLRTPFMEFLEREKEKEKKTQQH